MQPGIGLIGEKAGKKDKEKEELSEEGRGSRIM